QRRMHRDLEVGKVALEPGDRRQEALVANLVAAVRAAGEQKALQVVEPREVADLALERFRSARGNHRRQDLRLAVITVETAGAAGDRERRKALLAAAGKLGA